MTAWLSDLGKSKYEAKFVENFASLSELAIAASDPAIGAAGVLQECEVKGVRDFDSTPGTHHC